MAFRGEHRSLADAAMQVEAYRLYGRRARIPDEILNASYQASIRDDMQLRPNSSQGWYTATAEAVNEAIIEASQNAIGAVFEQYKVSALDGVFGVGAATVVAFTPANQSSEIAQPVEISRRAMLATGTAAAGVALFAPSQAAADNTGYIATVRNGARGYTGSTAPAVVQGVGAGIRG